MSERRSSYTVRDVITQKRHNADVARRGISDSGIYVLTASGEKVSVKKRTTRINEAVDGLIIQYEHDPWIQDQLDSLRPYLHSQGTHLTDDVHVRAHFRTGVHTSIDHLLSRAGSPFDIGETIVGFAGNFLDMLRTSEQLGIYPRSALMLATRSLIVPPEALISLAEKNSDLPKRVIVKAALTERPLSTPTKFIEDYRTNLAKMNEFRLVYPGFSDDRYAEAIMTLRVPPAVVAAEERVSDDHGFDGIKKGWVHVDGITHQDQKTSNWCAITTNSMDLQRMGYPITQTEIVERLFGDYDPLLEFMDPIHGPTFYELRGFLQREFGLYGQIIGHDTYSKLHMGTAARPWPVHKVAQILLQKILDSDTPVHIRTGSHTVLVSGYKKIKGKAANGDEVDTAVYSVINPQGGAESVWDEDKLVSQWGRIEDDGYNKDSRFLMMVIRDRAPQRR